MVRGAEEADFAELVRLERAAFGDHGYDPYALRQLFELFAPLAIVADAPDGAGLAAYALAGIAAGGREAWVLSVVVGPSRRRRGLGRALLLALLERLREHAAVTCRLSVAPGNAGAIDLYRSLGFVECAQAFEYFGPGEDRLIMELELAA